MATALIQPSLAGGVLSEELAARVDLALYGISVRQARNWIVRPTGGLVNRPGMQFLTAGKTNGVMRQLPFIVSESVAYVIELGAGHMRFLYRGALVTEAAKPITGATAANPVVVTAVAHGYTNGQEVIISGVGGMTQLNGRRFIVAGAAANTFQLQGVNGLAYSAYTSGGSAGRILEVTAPWAADDLFSVNYTQSADVMTLFHAGYPTKELRRLSATSFELRDKSFTDGPFAPMNANESIKVSSSGVEGAVTLTATSPIFTADMVDSLFYMEQKELRDVLPWVPDEKNVTVGSIRRSDGKYYRAVSVPVLTGLPGTPYHLNGNVRPSHEFGRAIDGPRDTRTDGTNGYKVGVEWEYLHGGYGIVRITGYTSTTVVTGLVTRRLPDAVVGGLAAPVNTWTFSGTGILKTFSTTGAVSNSARDYVVTIGGEPVTASPFQPPQNNGGQVPGGTITQLEP
jgi:hypothetical protein